MNTALLRHAHRDRSGVRRWTVPGAENQALLIPQRLTPRGWGDAFHWPATDGRGDPLRRGVDLNRHRGIARRAALDLVARAAEPAQT